jgi:hypothetical protein
MNYIIYFPVQNMADPFLPVSKQLLKHFEISKQEPGSYSELIDALADRIGEMLYENPDFLMSMLYRLDIREDKLKMAISPDSTELPQFQIAKLIVERQVERMVTREKYSKPPSEFDEY